MGEGFFGGGAVLPLCDFFWFLISFFKIRKWLLSVSLKLSQASLVEKFPFFPFPFFRLVEGGFRGNPKGDVPKGVPTQHKSWGVFSDILATASRFNSLYGLEAWYVKSSRYVRIIKKLSTFLTYLWRHHYRIVTSLCSFWLQYVS